MDMPALSRKVKRLVAIANKLACKLKELDSELDTEMNHGKEPAPPSLETAIFCLPISSISEVQKVKYSLKTKVSFWPD
jgi:hypothetical protein